MYSNNNENRTPAQWTVVAQDDSQNLVISRSEKGAFKIQQDRRMIFLKSSDIETIANASGLLMDYLTSDSYKDSIRQHELNKEKSKIEKQMLAVVERQKKLVQAAVDQLTASGMSPEQARQLISGQLTAKVG